MESWAERHAAHDPTSSFAHASVTPPDGDSQTDEPKLASSRAYSIALAPHLIYSRSNLISIIVSSKIHNQLDFQAVGSWFVLDTTSSSPAALTRVPGGREDVFQDTTLGLKAKRSLMKFLRFVTDFEEHPEQWESDRHTPFPEFLERKFGLPPASVEPILALTMMQDAPKDTTTESALLRISRHARSIGTFGPGFAAVLPKWGGLAELSQVACRACAVGGGIYVLGKSIEQLTSDAESHSLSLQLSGGEHVRTHRVVGTRGSLPASIVQEAPTNTVIVSKSVAIISSTLSALFPPTSEGGVTPAGAVVVLPSSRSNEPPVHILAHTSEAGECPSGQSEYIAPFCSCCNDDPHTNTLIYIGRTTLTIKHISDNLKLHLSLLHHTQHSRAAQKLT